MREDYELDLLAWCDSAERLAHEDVTPVLARTRRTLWELYLQLDEAYHDLCHINAPVKIVNRFDELVGLLDEAQVDCKCIADDIDEYVTEQEGYDYENV